MKKTIVLICLTVLFQICTTAQNVGIGTTAPLARLHVADSSVVFTAPGDVATTPGNIPVNGTGRRMLWYADKAAFRAGYVFNNDWSKSNVGNYSFAAGYDPLASGDASVALGPSANAQGYGCIAIGSGALATGSSAIAIGNVTYATGDLATAMGYITYASGEASTAMGNYVSTSGYKGSFIIGDYLPSDPLLNNGITQCYRNNEFRARFNGGYALYTNSYTTTGVFMVNGSNAWSSISDSTRKENYKKTDGEYVLNCISKMRLGSWNYKSQEAASFRHYGPMAQEFYNAFGNDGVGKIGSDTLINSADIDGVMMIGLQALEKRSSIWQKQSNQLLQDNEVLKTDNQRLQKRLTEIEATLADLKTSMKKISKSNGQ